MHIFYCMLNNILIHMLILILSVGRTEFLSGGSRTGPIPLLIQTVDRIQFLIITAKRSLLPCCSQVKPLLASKGHLQSLACGSIPPSEPANSEDSPGHDSNCFSPLLFSHLSDSLVCFPLPFLRTHMIKLDPTGQSKKHLPY